MHSNKRSVFKLTPGSDMKWRIPEPHFAGGSAGTALAMSSAHFSLKFKLEGNALKTQQTLMSPLD